ncbi:MAG: double-strand break repair helicase AddA [Alphaproteobacteria bacterium 65-37]|jgi:ATP-dependent helicase/nuclease subunit A|nr:MAG: double-strand break repair helicase AddA [Alphaproteobacteria bacterium 65-37]
MSDAFDPIAYATGEQRKATAPGHSAWVEANAGTGKTKVLTDRVTRLLLAGVRPERILCLTFTKAAAAEMRNRLASQLGRWAMADDAELTQAVARLIDAEPQAEQKVLARRLFARVLDAPGGINILTIHAFCQALLKRFPLEAGVAPGFEVMDEAEAATLLRQAQDEQVEALAEADAPEELRAALATVAGRVSIAEYAELMGKLLTERAWMLARIANEEGLLRLRRRLERQLGCDRPFDSTPDETGVRLAAKALANGGGKQDAVRADKIAAWLAASDRDAGLDDYASVFFTDKGDLRKTMATKGAVKLMGDIEAVLRREAERVALAVNHKRGTALVERTVALLRLGLDITGRYSRAKDRRAVLDYDDLIVATRRLLEGAGNAAWVLYKLDGGIDHVLVDEAQDTNPDQWEVIRQITEEFFAGESAVERPRTVFAVGDTKQSIFGFQRADPRKLAEMRNRFAEKSEVAQKPFVPIQLTVSFRSTPAVLEAVDWVFAVDEAAEGVAQPDIEVQHFASRNQEPGRVELWPLVAGAKSETDTTDFDAPRDALPPPHDRLARLIAAHAGSLIGKERRARDGELLHGGHFMVLVRRRNAFVNALVRALKQAGIEVAGVDRLNLGEELAIQDLLAMARFVLLPQDDLNLACLLKSPLVGLDEEQLFTLAWRRKGHLWRALREHATGHAADPAFTAAHGLLSQWLARADFTTPFDFFAQALGPEGGRRRLLERLGHEASDPIDELLARALQYQRVEAASLQGFLRWFEAGGSEIKRDLDANRRREVRILTVHASKGLQAPIVYLPDTTRVPRDSERLLAAEDGSARLWLPRTDDANEAAREWRAEGRRRALQEQNRLLYVAMTRAEDRLYVGGWIGTRRQDAGCWYDRIAAGLQASSEADSRDRLHARPREFDFTALLPDAGWTGDGYELFNDGHIAEPDQRELPLARTAELQDWVRRPAPAEPDPPAPLAPSQPLPDEALAESRAFSPLAADDPRRWQRGLLLHELLRHLPALPPDERPEAARRFLAQAAHGLAPEDVERWAAEALAVTEAPEHAALFAEGSRAEVPLIGTVQTPRGTFTVSGQVDRLAVSARSVLIVDFKTNRPPPRAADEVPLAYRRQLALYRALLQRIYPGHAVRAFLLWTAAPRLMEIDQETLEKSMPYASTSAMSPS